MTHRLEMDSSSLALVPSSPSNSDSGPSVQRWKDTHIFFTRTELHTILRVYGRKVAEGEWRDYAMGAFKESAVFAVFRHTAEVPLYRIEKHPKLARKQGAFRVVAATGLILKRGHDLEQVLNVFDKRALRLID